MALRFPFTILLPNLSGALRATSVLTVDLNIQSLLQTLCQNHIFLQIHTHLTRGEMSLTETEIMQVL